MAKKHNSPLEDSGRISFPEIVIAFFSAFVIMLVRMHHYERNMEQFFWSSGESQLADFFSYYKMVAILICATLAVLIILYKLTTGTFSLKKSYAYIPILIYSLFVALSYAFSDYKEFALLGYNDRFEGTLVLLAYMVMLFLTINIINSEKQVKHIIYPIAFSSGLLGILGLSQALDHDFFRTTIGKKLITPAYFWEHVDTLNFTFQNRQIYQTVYNINYVSFYLTLIVPLVAMLFIREKQLFKKIIWGTLFTLLIYNLIGSKSSGGIAGLFISVVIALILLNKRLLQWWKPVLVLILLTLVIGGITYERWYPEITGAARSMTGSSSKILVSEEAVEPGTIKPKIDYIETEEDRLTIALEGEPLYINISRKENGDVKSLFLTDSEDKPIPMTPLEDSGAFAIEDERFYDYATISYAYDEDLYYLFVNVPEIQWTFVLTKDDILYANQLGNPVKLSKVPAIGFNNNLNFGSGRGYIWSRTLPMIKDTLVLGHGADTYCIYFPHHDYAGKYTANWSVNKIVDKPHNMYMGMAIGTGLISLLAMLVLWIIYLIQSVRIYWKTRYDNDFKAFVGSGIFFGICGFLTAGLVNDSTVCVMPMFYGLLGTGIAINKMMEQ